MAFHFVLVERMKSVTMIEKSVAQKVGMWTGINLLHLVEPVANHQQAEVEAEVESEASW